MDYPREDSTVEDDLDREEFGTCLSRYPERAWRWVVGHPHYVKLGRSPRIVPAPTASFAPAGARPTVGAGIDDEA
ncbi:hypothetical protein FRC09_012619 [Ceratobasidium sp. 395]|nr:hypothetical protein FRC09_012619 [Ceratobasidium sp. 395]